MNALPLEALLAEPILRDGGTFPDLLRHMASQDSRLTSVEWAGAVISYRELLSMVEAEVDYLTALGVQARDVVASMVSSHPYSLASHLTAALGGALSAPVYIENEGAFLAKMLNVLQAKAVVVMPETEAHDWSSRPTSRRSST